MLTRRAALSTLAAVPLLRGAASDRVTFGFVGTGARGQELMGALQQNPGTEIVAVVDAYDGRAERAISRTEGRARRFPDYRALLADKSIDAIVVATPDHWHSRIVIDALHAGKDVYSEKPLTYRSSEGRAIIAAQKQTGRILQVGSQGVSSEVEKAAKEMIQSGRLGQITMIKAMYNRNTASGAWIYPIPPDASPKTVNWEMFLGSAPKRPFDLERFFRWRCYRDYSGGIATDLFVHLCTSIHFLMNAEVPARGVALGELYRWKGSRDVPDTLNAILEYNEGFTVTMGTTMNNQFASDGSFQIYGTLGTLVVGGSSLTFYPERPIEDNAWIVNAWAQPQKNAYYADPKVIAAEITSRQAPPQEPERINFSSADPTIAHFGHFLNSIKTREPYWENASAGHHAAACAHLVNQAAAQHRMVEWDFSKDDIKNS